jgi:hypothetical protein
MKIKNQLFEKMMDRHILELQRIPMPIKISYYLKDIMGMLGKESKPFFEKKKEIISRHQNGDKIPPENTAAFLKEVNEIYNEEIELDIQKLNIRIDDLPNLSVMQIDFIETFFNIQG